MGTWGIGSFDNDDAADFMIDVLDSGDLALVHEALDNVLTSVRPFTTGRVIVVFGCGGDRDRGPAADGHPLCGQ